MSETGKVSRIYSNFRGVDFRGLEINLIRSPDALNMYKDYLQTESICTRPGLALHTEAGAPVYGVFQYKGALLLHIGERLVKAEGGVLVPIFEGLAQRRSNSFVYNDIFYFMDGQQYLRYDGQNCAEVTGYVPTTTIGKSPEGGGETHEDVNLLSDYRINSFLSDGGSFVYYLDRVNIDNDYAPEVTVNDELVSAEEYEVDYEAGSITFLDAAPSAPDTDGQDNVFIKFKKAMSGYRSCIEKCTLVQVFDNRVFVSGNPDHPNMVWHCSLNDPTYWSDLDYYEEGMDDSPISGLVAGNNALWVFRQPSDANTTVFYHTPVTDGEYGKIYPSAHSSVTTGCVGGAINFNDDIVFFSDRGMEGISGDITTEQVLAHRSSLVDRKLLAEEAYRDMILCEWNGYLCVFIGKAVYLADSRAMFQNVNHYEYEWFYWELENAVQCATVIDGVLYIGTAGGVYTLTDKEADLQSYWVTPLDKFQNPHRMKTTNKRGCVVEGTGAISVYAKTERTAFELVGEYEDVTDFFVPRIKRKKFKDIQLKFYSDKRFSLETVTLESYIGGYIKR